MNKALLKNFAVAARIRLMQDVRYRLGLMGITKKGISTPRHQAVDMEEYEYAPGQSFRLFGADVAARRQLADMVRAKGFEQLVEEVAYTWFNRLIAIRFMEVNDYLPTHTRVLSSITPGQSTPDIVTRALEVDLGLTEAEKQQVLEWKLSSQTDELFRFLFLRQCSQLGELLPGLFGEHLRQDDRAYALLLTISCISPEGIVAELLRIPEAYFNVSAVDEDGQPTGQVQIIGWMYQYYNAELKDDTFTKLKKNIKITKERIPAATQLFTPEWIVKYMVENSLGRLWLEGHPNTSLQNSWRYYLPEAQQEPEVAAQLAKLREDAALLKLEEIKFLDPCMGSGHILVYAFDLLMEIYRTQGYTDRDAVQSIVANNLYGLDIDDRAAQLTYFAVMMKACEYDKRFLSRKIQPHVYAIQESNGLDAFDVLPGQMQLSDSCLQLANKLIEVFCDAKLYGSLIQVELMDISQLGSLMDELKLAATGNLQISAWFEQKAALLLPQLARQMIVMADKYEVVVTNPPYMGSSGMNNKLSDCLKKFYPDSKSDLFAVFIERCTQMTKCFGFQAMITQQSFYFLSGLESLRKKIIKDNVLVNSIHMGLGAFGNDFGTVAFVFQKMLPYKRYIGRYYYLGGKKSVEEKEELFLSQKCPQYYQSLCEFEKLPNCTYSYMADLKAFYHFGRTECLQQFFVWWQKQNS